MNKLDYFKKKILAHLETLESKEKAEKREIKKSILNAEMLQKGGFPVGTKREWRGKKCMKVAPKKWRRIYDSESGGSKRAIAALKREISKAQDVHEVLDIVLANKARFCDKDGRPLAIVKELSAYAKESGSGKIKARAEKTQGLREHFSKQNEIEQEKKIRKNLEKIDSILDRNIEPMPAKIEFSKENFDKLFKNGIDSPIEHIKIGENQFEKLKEKGREGLMSAMADVIKNPALVLKTTDNAKIYAKTYESNSHKKTVVSVIVSKGKLKISISTHIERNKQLAKKMDSILFERTESVHGEMPHEEQKPQLGSSVQHSAESVKQKLESYIGKQVNYKGKQWNVQRNDKGQIELMSAKPDEETQLYETLRPSQDKEKLQKFLSRLEAENSFDEPPSYTSKLRKTLKENLKDSFGLHKNKSTGIEANLSGKSVDKMSSEKAIEKSKANGFTVDEHFEVANKIVSLFENAELTEISEDKKGSPDLKSIKRFDCDVTLSDGKKANAHITVKESVQNGHKIYSVEVMTLRQKKSRSENNSRAGVGQSILPLSSTNTVAQNTDAVKQKAVEDFEKGLNFKLQNDTKEKLKNEMSEYTIGALNEVMAEFIKKITPFTMKHLDETIDNYNAKCKKEKMPILKLTYMVKRDYLISLKDKENEHQAHKNRSEAMKGNQNAKKNGVSAIREHYEATKSVLGGKKSYTLPNGTKIKCRYKIVEADAPTASHDEITFAPSKDFPTNEKGQNINDRDYQHDNSAQESVRRIAQNFNALALQDLPIVTKDGIVLSGNNRTMSSKLAAKNGTDRAYIAELKEQLSDGEFNGLDENDIKGFKNPRIILEVVDEHKGDYTTNEFAQFNRDTKKTMSNVEKAVKLTKTLNPDKIKSIASPLAEYETLGELYADVKGCQAFANALIENGIIGENEKAQYCKSDGTLNDTGKDFVETVLVGSVLNESNIRKLDSDGGRRIRQKLVRAILPLVENKGTGNEYSFNKELNDAVDIAVEVSKNHDKYKTVKDYTEQMGLFGEERTDKATERLAEIIHDDGEKAFAARMKDLGAGLSESAAGTIDIFLGGVETKDDLMARFLEIKKSIARMVANAFLRIA